MTTESLIAVFFGLLALALWMIPTLVAFLRKHPKRKAIFLFDLLLSWTIVGWFFALAWALLVVQESVPGEQPETPKAKTAAA